MLQFLMALKTQKNNADVTKFLDSVKDEGMRADCESVKALMEQLTGAAAKMWGKSIVGFGSFRYRGKTSEGEWFPVGFSPRKNNLTLYLHCCTSWANTRSVSPAYTSSDWRMPMRRRSRSSSRKPSSLLKSPGPKR